jgi:hypothetical protein
MNSLYGFKFSIAFGSNQAIIVDDFNLTPPCVTDVALENTPGEYEAVTVEVLATFINPLITGDPVATSLVGWMTVNTL